MRRDPETQRRPRRTVPRMRPHHEHLPAGPPPHRVVAIVTVEAAAPGRDLPDVHVSARTAATWLGALTAAEDAAAGLVPPGCPFRVSTRQRIDWAGRLVPAPPAS
jgi:hypothetical protein